MEVVALYTRLRPGQELAYEEFHARVPDEITEDLRARGVHEWRIWRHGRDLFHVVMAEDYASFAASEPLNVTAQQWGTVMAQFLEVNNDLSEPSKNTMAEVWSLSGQLAITADDGA
jgi:L-rhamnose mutarotase